MKKPDVLSNSGSLYTSIVYSIAILSLGMLAWAPYRGGPEANEIRRYDAVYGSRSRSVQYSRRYGFPEDVHFICHNNVGSTDLIQTFSWISNFRRGTETSHSGRTEATYASCRGFSRPPEAAASELGPQPATDFY
jgi:hypothetical protein